MISTRRGYLHGLLFLCLTKCLSGFAVVSDLSQHRHHHGVVHPVWKPLGMSDGKQQQYDGVVELGDDDEKPQPPKEVPKLVAPFISQGELAEGVLNPDLSDPKQTRVIIYIIISLIPVLFLIPLMIGSRDLIPLDALPPVEL